MRKFPPPFHFSTQSNSSRFLYDIESVIVDIRGSVNDFTLGRSRPRNLAYIHCGIHILKNLIAHKAILGADVVVRTLNTEQASL